MAKKKKNILSKASFGLRAVVAFIFIVLFPSSVFLICYFVLNFVPVYVYAIMVVLGVCGWWMLTDVILAVVKIIGNAKHNWAEVVGSEYYAGDIDFLHEAFDRMSSRVKSGVEELSEISKTSEKLNQDVVANVTLLSAVIKLNELMSVQSEDSVVFDFIVRKLRDVLLMDTTFLLLEDKATNRYTVSVLDSVRRTEFDGINKDDAFIRSVVVDSQMVIVDQQNSYRSDFVEFFNANLGLQNLIIMPIVINGETVAMLGCGAVTDRHVFSTKDIEIIEFFLKYIVYSLKQNMASVAVKDSEIKDALTGLYTEMFLVDRLDEEIEKTRQNHKPCGLVLVKLGNFKDYLQKKGTLAVEADLKRIARVLIDDLQEGEKAARCSEDVFGIITPGVNKAKLEHMAVEVMKRLDEVMPEKYVELGLKCSVAEIPIDGLTTDELISHAGNCLMAGV